MIWAYAMDYKKGESCDLPFDATTGKNVLPAEAGTYYYLLRAPRIKPDAPDNYIEVTAPKIDLKGGSVSLLTWCEADDPFIVDNTLTLRHRVLSNQYCLIRIVRGTSAAADEAFDIRFAPEQAYDTFDDAPTLLTGFEEETPGFAGTYYYSVTSPEEQGMILNVKSDYQAINRNISVKLCSYRLGPNYVLADGSTSLSYNTVDPSTKYIIIWSSVNDDKSIPFTVTFDKAPQGDTAFWPLDAETGKNDIPAGETKFFSYTATQDGWMKIAPSRMELLEKVKVTREDGVSATAAAFAHDNFYQVAVTKGLKYTMTFSNIPEGASFELSEAPFTTGDTFELAEKVDGSFTMNKYEGLYWYKYEVPSDGLLTISTNLKFGFGHGTLEGTMSAIAAYVNNNEDYILLEPDYFTNVIYPVSIPVHKDDIVYLEIGLIESLQEINVNLSLGKAEPGDTPETAIVIPNQGNPTSFDFPALDYKYEGTWYAIDLYPGKLEMAATGSLLLELYADDDLKTPITRGGFISYDVDTDEEVFGFGFGNEYYPTARIYEARRYLLCIKYIEKCSAVFTGTALVNTDGVESVSTDNVKISAAHGMITVSGADKVEVFNLTGSHVASTECNGQPTTIALPAGVYVVKADGKVAKVRL